MRNFFGSDSTLMKVLGKMFDMAYLSLVFILFCLPVVTIGASLTALYYTTVKVIRRERGYVFQEFLRSFKLNFVTATIFWVLQVVLLFVMDFNVSTVVEQDGGKIGIMSGAYIVIGVFIYAISVYAYPILSRFDMKRTKMLRLAFYMMLKHFYCTIPMVILSAGSILAIVFLANVLPIIPLLLPTLATYINSFMMEWMFKKYMPKSEEYTEDGERIVQWYEE